MRAVPELPFQKFYKGCYNKKSYKTWKDAQEFADYIYGKFGTKCHVYKCEYNLHYHLTTKKSYDR